MLVLALMSVYISPALLTPQEEVEGVAVVKDVWVSLLTTSWFLCKWQKMQFVLNVAAV